MRTWLVSLSAFCVAGSAAPPPDVFPPDEMPYHKVLWAGTHNSAINLGDQTLARPSKAIGGRFPSEAASAYQYPVMDQRISVRDQLEQGIRVIDLEIASLTNDWICSTPPPGGCDGSCQSEPHDTLGKCFSCCPFIVSHGSLDQSVTARLGYTYPEDVFRPIGEWIKENPYEIVTLFLIRTHGNVAPPNDAIVERLNASGILEHVWNHDPEAVFDTFPTLGEMRAAGRTVLISGPSWGPRTAGSHVNSTDIDGADSTCIGGTPCMEGWDSVVFEQLSPERAILSGSTHDAMTLFHVDNLSSRRGRGDKSAKYTWLPNVLVDTPFHAGGNPWQASLAADYNHVINLEARWAELLAPQGMVPNWILVDFFNTTTPREGMPSRTLLPNPSDGFVRAVRDINQKRVSDWFENVSARKALV